MNPIVLILAACAWAKVVQLNFDIHRGNSLETANKNNKREYVKREISQLDKRDDPLQVELSNEQSFYAVDIQIGQNRQNISVLIDTGSSDLWVMAASNPYCTSSGGSQGNSRSLEGGLKNLQGAKEKIGNRQVLKRDALSSVFSVYTSYLGGGGGGGGEQETATSSTPATYATPTSDVTATLDCNTYGTYDEFDSNSFRFNSTEFLIQYADYTFAHGEYGYDNVVIGGSTVQDLSFAIANQTNSSMGVLGIGLPGSETTYSGSLSGTNRYQYENLPMKMVSQGLINTNAYSLYLNSSDAQTGTILFGGVDHAKYEGTLQTVPIINRYRSMGYVSPIALDVTLSSVSYNSSDSSEQVTGNTYTALLDSGTTAVYAPASELSRLAAAVGASYSSNVGAYVMDCSDVGSDQFLTFDFTGAQVRVPVSDLLIRINALGYSGNCVFGVFPQSSPYYILGGSFLKSAYVVYDLDNLEISIAQSRADTDESDIEAISSTVPSAVAASDYSSSYTGSPATTSGFASASSTGGGSGGSNRDSAGLRAGVSLVVLLGSLAVVLCL